MISSPACLALVIMSPVKQVNFHILFSPGQLELPGPPVHLGRASGACQDSGPA